MKTLTLRQRQVIQLVAAGKSNVQIAAHLGISPSTVGVHRTGAYRKLGAHNTATAIAEATRRGFIPTAPAATS